MNPDVNRQIGVYLDEILDLSRGVEPVSFSPSALNVKLMGVSPAGPAMDPAHFPSTSAAKAGIQTTRISATIINGFMMSSL